MPTQISDPPMPNPTLWHELIHSYRRYLSVSESTSIITLCEGDTPQVAAPRLAAAFAG